METYFDNMHAPVGTSEKLAQDLRTLLYDAEDLLKTANESLTEKARIELQTILARLKANCERLSRQADNRTRKLDRLIHEYPYPAAAVAFALGLLIGSLWRSEESQD
jgi:ElaB/YqjD/DUF883 family membrane-anchored ribosome-binding protein